METGLLMCENVVNTSLPQGKFFVKGWVNLVRGSAKPSIRINLGFHWGKNWYSKGDLGRDFFFLIGNNK